MADTPFRDVPERPASPGLLSCWWRIIQAHNECAGLPSIHPDDLILHFNGSGTSCMVFAKDITAACALIDQHKETHNG
jgi:hypothetical protein